MLPAMDLLAALVDGDAGSLDGLCLKSVWNAMDFAEKVLLVSLTVAKEPGRTGWSQTEPEGGTLGTAGGTDRDMDEIQTKCMFFG